MPPRAVRAALLVAGACAAPLECGVATNQFSSNPPTLSAAVQTGKLRFWWNWNVAPAVDTHGLSPATVGAMQASFVPMVWGSALPASLDFVHDAEGDVMGFNEPDLYGPSCCNCDGKQSYYPATSSGWLPLFNPVSAAAHWHDTVNALTNSTRLPSGRQLDTGRRLVSPSMANGATPTAGVDCTKDPADAQNPSRCEGWLRLFKTAALKLACTGFDGRQTNCWDVIGALQVRARPLT